MLAIGATSNIPYTNSAQKNSFFQRAGGFIKRHAKAASKVAGIASCIASVGLGVAALVMPFNVPVLAASIGLSAAGKLLLYLGRDKQTEQPSPKVEPQEEPKAPEAKSDKEEGTKETKKQASDPPL